ncbi:MAG: glycosyltransferase [Verrucomicrobiota bacterium]
MNVVHLSTYDVRGGAALAAYRLHRAMLKRSECHSRMLVGKKESRDPSVSPVYLSESPWPRIRRVWQRREVLREHAIHARAIAKQEIFSDDRGWWTDSIAANIKGADVVQLHWICQFLNYSRFFQDVPMHIPLVWRLADKNPLTGGCHYDSGCGRFESACGSCPKLDSSDSDDLSHQIWARKKSALERITHERLHIVALNQWMRGQVRRSSLLGRFDCSVIPNGVDLDEFKPINPVAAREALLIPPQSKVVAFVAESASNERKGFALLLEALRALRDRANLFLLIVGDTQQLPPIGLPNLQVGLVQSVAFLRLIYSAAHVFVISSLEDNQPNTVLESMACGTPVVGFNVDGIPEMVEHGKTGWLATPGSVSELAQGIEALLDRDAERLAMGSEARLTVEQSFSRNRQVAQYLTLYQRLLESRQVGATVSSRVASSGPDSDGCASNSGQGQGWSGLVQKR